ncbi:MAG: sodium:proton antiporter [Ignavibacteriaceae bacterium]
MELYHAFAILIVLSAAYGYINHRYLRLPFTIGMMVIALISSLLIVAIGNISPGFKKDAVDAIQKIDFSQILLNVMLSFLLFAGAINVDLASLRKERYPVIIFATIGVVISTFIFGTLIYYFMIMIGQPVDYIYSLLFGALISPTDPVAVLGILKEAGIPKSLEIKITGESLFNDGVAVVIFASIYQVAQIGIENLKVFNVALLFLREAGGGIILGSLVGYLGYILLKSIDNYKVEVLITLALVTGGYSMAELLQVSGPLAMVAAGIITGNTGKKYAMSDTTQNYIDKFWEMIDEILNALLFILIGFEILVIKINPYFLVGLFAIGALLVARFISVGIPIALLKFKRGFVKHSIWILTWGGLRGGISVALALSLQNNMYKNFIVSITYIIVLFSIIVQGLTVGKLVKKLKIQAKIPVEKEESLEENYKQQNI